MTRHSRPTLIIAAMLLLAAGALADEPLDAARERIAAGQLAEAEALLRPLVPDPDAPVTTPAAIQLEIIRRLRLDYDQTPEALLDAVRRSIADVTAADLDRWREQGGLQYRVLDGRLWYFDREPANLWRFCEEARTRRAPRPSPAGWDFNLPAHLERLLREASVAEAPEVHPVRHHVRYELTVRGGSPRARPGALVRCWLPFPQEYRQQRDVKLIASDPHEYKLAPNGHPQRTLYFERTIEDPAAPLTFTAEFEFTTAAYCPALDAAQAQVTPPNDPLSIEFTAQRAPHAVFSPLVMRALEEIGPLDENPLRRARQIFRWCCAHVKYAAEVEYSTIPSLADKALETGRGDCGVQALAFITLCRAAGIPARWQSGWETLPNGLNMHDWAEFYVAPWGWLPADPSYGLQEHADPEVREFFCGRMDPYRMIVNLDYGRALYPEKTSFRSEPSDFQRGEVEIDGHNLYYDEWDWDFELRTTPIEGGLPAMEEACDARVPRLLTAGGVPGAVVEIGRLSDGGFRTWRKAYGWLAMEPQRVPMRPDAVFDVASLTKPVAVGTSLMILVDRGRVRLDDPVAKYLPEFDTDAKRAITVRHLMAHTSGLPAYLDAAAQRELRETHGFPCPAALRARVRNTAPLHAAGEQVLYSCLNAILCGEIVAAVAGEPLDRFAAANVFEPLGMRDTRFLPADAELPEDLRARLVPSTRAEHGRGPGGFLLGQVHDPLAALAGGVAGNAGLFSTAEDLGRFAQMVLSRGARHGFGVRVLSEAAVEEMTRLQTEGRMNSKGAAAMRGLSWDMYAVGDAACFGHTGYTGGALRIWPKANVYAIVLTNRVHPDDNGKVEDLRREMWSMVEELLVRP